MNDSTHVINSGTKLPMQNDTISMNRRNCKKMENRRGCRKADRKLRGTVNSKLVEREPYRWSDVYNLKCMLHLKWMQSQFIQFETNPLNLQSIV